MNCLIILNLSNRAAQQMSQFIISHRKQKAAHLIEVSLTTNVSESGPMPTPWNFLARLLLVPSCKLGQN